MLTIFEASGEYQAGQALRRCGRCGGMKPVTAFLFRAKARGTLKSYCTPCSRAYAREHYERNKAAYVARARKWRDRERPRIRARIDEYLRSHPCVDCGESAITLLEFDHRERAEKRLAVADLARNSTWSRLRREIEKCDVRCANCHRRRTAVQFAWAKVTGIRLDGQARPGSVGRYAKIELPRQEPLFSSSPDGLRSCSNCGQLKALAEFALRDMRGAKHGHYCRPCRRAYRRAHYERNRSDYLSRAALQVRRKREDVLLLLHAYLRSHPCVDCGEANIVVLEFDHRDSATKRMTIGAMIGSRAWPVILAEIQKCDVRCANCHRHRTAAQRGWKSRLGESGGLYRAGDEVLTLYNRSPRGCSVVVTRNIPNVQSRVRFPPPAQFRPIRQWRSGSAAVSRTAGRRFESFLPCRHDQRDERLSFHETQRLTGPPASCLSSRVLSGDEARVRPRSLRIAGYQGVVAKTTVREGRAT